jgi:GABA(A) receptor-associated protein
MYIIINIINHQKIMEFDFKNQYTIAKRKTESASIKIKYPNRIAVICEVVKRDRDTLILDKKKFLVPSDLTVGQFVHIIRRRIKLSSDQALFIFTSNNTIPAISSMMGQIYNECVDDDGFIYFCISAESTFGHYFNHI